jgi:hypothetical protein
MPGPSILNDGTLFFVNVLRSEEFKRKGLLTDSEGRISWAVLDPRRHIMTIWEKDRQDFVTAALARNASVITNAPFLLYHKDRNKIGAYLGYQWDSLWMRIGFGIARASNSNQNLQNALNTAEDMVDGILQQEYFSSQKSEGYIFGTSESITHNAADESRPNASYFGRNTGRLFANYTIARGDAPRITEVIGGLFQSVLNYAAVDSGSAAQAGCWGLAPLLESSPQCDALRESGLAEVLAEYEEVARHPGEEGVPFGEGVDSAAPCTGLIVALFGGGAPDWFANTLSAVLVKEAVRVDGNDSILLATEGKALRGDGMPYYKLTYNRYGYQFKQG